MVKTFWSEKIEVLEVINHEYRIVFDILGNLYYNQKRDIIEIYAPDKLRIIPNLSSRELDIYFVEEILFKRISFDEFMWFVDYYSDKPVFFGLSCPYPRNTIFY